MALKVIQHGKENKEGDKHLIQLLVADIHDLVQATVMLVADIHDLVEAAVVVVADNPQLAGKKAVGTASSGRCMYNHRGAVVAF